MTATVAVSAATVAEGSNAVFTVTLSGGTSTAPVVVSYETSGSATSATDYTAPSGSLTIAAGGLDGDGDDCDPYRHGSGPGRDAGASADRVERRRRLVGAGHDGDGDDHDHRFRRRDGGHLDGLGERRRGPDGDAHRVAVGDGVWTT